MARPPQFDRDEVLWKATLLFWERGYRGVSISDIVQATGLLPGSIYAGFGNKEGLFLACLERYNDGANHMRAEFEQGKSPMECVRLFFRTMIEQSADEDDRRGCFLVNVSLECNAGETAIKTKVRTCMDQGETWLRMRLDAAKAEGEIKPKTDTARLAACLMGSVFGFRVMSRAQEDAAKIHDVASTMYDSLVSPWLLHAA
jgi:TetR/AcrR family transcriptional repressor of nem operon